MLSRLSALCLATGAGLGPKKSQIVPQPIWVHYWGVAMLLLESHRYCRRSAGLAVLSASDLLAQAGVAGFRLKLTLYWLCQLRAPKRP